MRIKKTWPVWVAAVVVALVLALPATASAMTMRQGDSVTVAKGEVLNDDLYAFGNSVTIDGTVNGDVIAFGQTVVINGEVRGSVAAGAQLVRIPGMVNGSVRAGAQMVDIDGVVDGDVVAGANRVNIGGEVKRDLIAGATAVNITGAVGRNVMAASESLTVAGAVAGNVDARAANVIVTDQGSVAGNLDYTSAQPASIHGTVSGTTTQHEPPARQQEQGSGTGGAVGLLFAVVLGWVQSLVGIVILGLLLVLVAHQPMLLGSQAVFDRFWPSLGVGLLVFFFTPMVAGLVFVVGLFIGAWWLSFVLMAVYWLLLLAGLVVGSLAVGRAILRRTSHTHEPALAWSVLLGLVLVWVVAVVPFLGWLAAWAVMLFGTGALVLVWMGKAQKPVPAVVTAPAMPEPSAAPDAPAEPAVSEKPASPQKAPPVV